MEEEPTIISALEAVLAVFWERAMANEITPPEERAMRLAHVALGVNRPRGPGIIGLHHNWQD